MKLCQHLLIFFALPFSCKSPQESTRLSSEVKSLKQVTCVKENGSVYSIRNFSLVQGNRFIDRATLFSDGKCTIEKARVEFRGAWEENDKGYLLHSQYCDISTRTIPKEKCADFLPETYQLLRSDSGNLVVEGEEHIKFEIQSTQFTKGEVTR